MPVITARIRLHLYSGLICKGGYSLKRITEVTRRDILEIFRNGLEIDDFFETRTVTYCYYGRLAEIDFLKRIYQLGKMPSYDSRFQNAADDIWQHTVNNNDYPYCWMFEDNRFNLKDGNDEDYLRFLTEIFHLVISNKNLQIYLVKSFRN